MLDLNDRNVIASERQRLDDTRCYEDAADVTAAQQEANECVVIEEMLNAPFRKYGYSNLELIADGMGDYLLPDFAPVLEVVKASFKTASTIDEARKAINEAELGRIVAGMMFQKLQRVAEKEMEDRS